MGDKKYYLCTFKTSGEGMNDYTIAVLDYHPVEFVFFNNAVLIDHIEINEEQYNKYYGRCKYVRKIKRDN